MTILHPLNEVESVTIQIVPDNSFRNEKDLLEAEDNDNMANWNSL